MYAKVDLEIQLQELEKFTHAQYLTPELNEIAHKLHSALKSYMHKLEEGDEQVHKLSMHMSEIFKYFQGSTLNAIPSEIEYCLRVAINDWFPKGFECTIAVAQIDEKGFHIDFKLWQEIVDIISKKIPNHNLDIEIILVEIPKLYNNFPIFYTALYHEIGHFVDGFYEISFNSLMSDESVDESDQEKITQMMYHEEYFADLFAARYVGNTIIETLQSVSANATASDTHPATQDRVDRINKLLNGENFDELDAFQEELSVNIANFRNDFTLPRLEKIYREPEIASSLNDLRPVEIVGNEELHGILVAGWSYLKNIDVVHKPEWKNDRTDLQVAQTVSDLIGKSISNHEISNKWKKHWRPGESKSKPNVDSLIHKRLNAKEDSKKLWILPLLEYEQCGDLTVDLRLGCDFLVSVPARYSNVSIDSTEKDFKPIEEYFRLTRRNIGMKFMLYPKQLVLTTTLEYIGLPDDCCANVHMRSSFAKLGMNLEVLVEQGYRGCVQIQLLNNSNQPVELIVGERMFQLKLTEQGVSSDYGGFTRKYAGLVGPVVSRISDDKDLQLLKSYAEDSSYEFD